MLIECKECGEKFETLVSLSYHVKMHGGLKFYYDKHEKKENEEKCSFCGDEVEFISFKKGYYDFCKKCRNISRNPIQKMYWIIRHGLTEEAAIERVREEQARRCSFNKAVKSYWKNSDLSEEEIEKERIEFARKNSRRCVEYWLERGYSKEDAKKEVHKVQSNGSLETMIRRNGEKEGKKKYKKHRENLKGNQSLEWFIQKYGEEEGKKKYKIRCNNQKRALSKSGMIKKYGEEEGKLEWKRFCGSRIQSEDRFIKLYGEEEGKKKWNDYMLKKQYLWYKQNKTTWSKISQKLFWKIYKKIKNKYKHIYFATLNVNKLDENGNHEHKVKVWNIKKKKFTNRYLDFYVKDVNKVIEFDGEFWHKDRENEDLIRENEIKKSLGDVKTFHISEKEFKEHPNLTVKKCINFLEE